MHPATSSSSEHEPPRKRRTRHSHHQQVDGAVRPRKSAATVAEGAPPSMHYPEHQSAVAEPPVPIQLHSSLLLDRSTPDFGPGTSSASNRSSKNNSGHNSLNVSPPQPPTVAPSIKSRSRPGSPAPDGVLLFRQPALARIAPARQHAHLGGDIGGGATLRLRGGGAGSGVPFLTSPPVHRSHSDDAIVALAQLGQRLQRTTVSKRKHAAVGGSEPKRVDRRSTSDSGSPTSSNDGSGSEGSSSDLFSPTQLSHHLAQLNSHRHSTTPAQPASPATTNNDAIPAYPTREAPAPVSSPHRSHFRRASGAHHHVFPTYEIPRHERSDSGNQQLHHERAEFAPHANRQHQAAFHSKRVQHHHQRQHQQQHQQQQPKLSQEEEATAATLSSLTRLDVHSPGSASGSNSGTSSSSSHRDNIAAPASTTSRSSASPSLSPSSSFSSGASSPSPHAPTLISAATAFHQQPPSQQQQQQQQQHQHEHPSSSSSSHRLHAKQPRTLHPPLHPKRPQATLAAPGAISGDEAPSRRRTHSISGSGSTGGDSAQDPVSALSALDPFGTSSSAGSTECQASPLSPRVSDGLSSSGSMSGLSSESDESSPVESPPNVSPPAMKTAVVQPLLYADPAALPPDTHPFTLSSMNKRPHSFGSSSSHFSTSAFSTFAGSDSQSAAASVAFAAAEAVPAWCRNVSPLPESRTVSDDEMSDVAQAMFKVEQAHQARQQRFHDEQERRRVRSQPQFDDDDMTGHHRVQSILPSVDRDD